MNHSGFFRDSFCCRSKVSEFGWQLAAQGIELAFHLADTVGGSASRDLLFQKLKARPQYLASSHEIIMNPRLMCLDATQFLLYTNHFRALLISSVP